MTNDPTRDLSPRAALYVPASEPRMLDKAAALDTDAVIVDLEDSVAPDAKDAARERATEWFAAGDRGGVRVLRLNGLDSRWHTGDIAALASLSRGAAKALPDAVLLPKCDDAQAVRRLEAALDAASVPDSVRVWAMLETPRAVLSMPTFIALADEGSRLAGFCVGNNDLAKEAGLADPLDRALLQPWYLQFLAGARACGCLLLDGVWNDFADTDGFARDCAASAGCGFDGRTVIHPTQIAAARAAYAPDDATLERARRIVEAFDRPEHAGRGAISLDGQMVERLHLDIARRTLARAHAQRDSAS